MKTLLLLSGLILAAAATARASELRYLPGGQPTCQSEEQEGCAIGHKVVQETPAGSPQVDCFKHQIAVLKGIVESHGQEMSGNQVAAVAALCKAPSKASTDCFYQSIDEALKAHVVADTLAIAKMCSAAK